MKRYRVHVEYRQHFMAPLTSYDFPESDLETAEGVLKGLVETGWQVHTHSEWIEIWCQEHGWKPCIHDECIECYGERSRHELAELQAEVF